MNFNGMEMRNIRNLLLAMLTFCLFWCGQQHVYGLFSGQEICLPDRHEANRTLCARILRKASHELPPSLTPRERADALSRKLDVLARELLSQGFDLNAYTYKRDATSPYVQFSMIALWEGGYECKPEIPLTLFIYVWPPEQFAQQLAIQRGAAHDESDKGYYASNIHSHPITCGVILLQGTLCQENYRAVKGWPFKVARKENEEILAPGTISFDDGSLPFIHRLVCRDEGQTPAISLHGYGAPSERKVRHLFRENFERDSYQHILQENGQLRYQAW
jgi:hypothetical protein